MKFTKMEGLGNDYLYFYEVPPADVSKLAVLLSDRHCGVGSDGLIYISESRHADYRMRIFNADGSEAKMCGNGIRCVGKYLYDRRITEKTELRIETESGIRTLLLHTEGGEVTSVSVDMGSAEVSGPELLQLGNREIEIYPVSVGNPHAVCFTDKEGLALPEQIGSLVERNERFPGGVNAEFAAVQDRTAIRMRVWERGSGVTMACGTGACATAAAAVYAGYCPPDEPLTVCLDGGNLEITVESSGTLWMRGPAAFVYEAEIELKGRNGYGSH